jgi:Cu(I)/Ag(I) efflux system membrane fusion protein
MKKVLLIVLPLAIAIPVTWFVARRVPSEPSMSAETGTRKILYYQSAMHPWIKSDKPGRCTICGMELTPVYEGEAGFDAAGGGDVVPLGQSSIRALNVATVPAAKTQLERSLTVAGVIDDNAKRHRVLSAYVPGRITKLYVNYIGAEVKEGEPLAEFYSPVLLQAEREYRSLSGELRKATALRLLQMGLTQGQIEQLPQKSPDSLTSQILAPIGGTVVSQNVYEGQYVQEGERLFEIADFATMWFQFNAYEQDLPWIRLGQRVDVATPALPGRIFTGEVAFIDPNFDLQTRSTKVRVELDNPLVEGRRLLSHRLYADGVVHLEAPEVLTVPRSAVIQTGREAVAYVDAGGGAYVRRELLLGRRGDKLVEVLSGLNPGDPVVVSGNLLIDGQAEMNRSFATPVTAKAAPATALPELNSEQSRALQELAALAVKLSQALSADDLAAFNRDAALSHSVIPSVGKTFASNSEWQELLRPVDTSGHLREAASLPEARRAFQKFNAAVVPLIQAAHKAGSTLDVRVFQCPMTKAAYDGAPERAEWVQTGASAHNPYFGAAMLDCGAEVKP